MKVSKAITDADLQDYIEGRLEGSKRGRVEERLTRDPELAAEVERLRRQASRLREFGDDLLSEPVPAEMLNLIKNFQVH